MERFWAKVDIREPDDCWPWTGNQLPKGYGLTSIHIDGVRYYAHRLSWRIAHDMAEIPDGLIVMHTCDNPPCCNPAHLLLGTYTENNVDMYTKGRGGNRGSPGERNGAAKITAEVVAIIRTLYATGEYRHVDLVDRFGISQSQVGRILRNESWTHVNDSPESASP